MSADNPSPQRGARRGQPGRRAKLAAALLSLSLGACAALEPKPNPALDTFRAVAPRSILVVPVVNESLEVEAGNYLLSTLPIPLAERGYYVFPVNTVKFVLEQEGYYEADRVAQQDPAALAALFGADAILYLTIKRWDAQYVVLATTITVQLEYRMVAADGQEIWKETRTKQYTPDGNQNAQASGLAALLAAAVTAAAARANPNYLELASQANNEAIGQGFNAVPLGPYMPKEPEAAAAPPPAAPAAGAAAKKP